MSGAFRFWKRVLCQSRIKSVNTKSAATLAAVTSWVVWKRVDTQTDSKEPIPCEKEFTELQKFYDRVKSPEKLNFFNKKAYMRLERNIRTCAEANPGFFEKSEISSGTPFNVVENSGKEKDKPQDERSVPSLEDRLKVLERNTWIFGGKDVVVFLPKEEQEIKSTARLPVSEVSEDRGALLPNGDINWRCTCIERELVGPCNVEFRAFREHVHNTRKPDEDTTDEEFMAAREVIGNFLDCAKRNEEFYKSIFEDDEEDDEIYEAAEEEYNKQKEKAEVKKETAEVKS